jgi:hypothetical protein
MYALSKTQVSNLVVAPQKKISEKKMPHHKRSKAKKYEKKSSPQTFLFPV